MSRASLFEQQRSNRRRSAVLVITFLLFFAWLGFGGDLAFYLNTAGAVEPTAYHHVFPWFGVGATLLGAGIAWHGWRRGPQEILWATGAWELVSPHRPEEKVLVNVVEEMTIASGLPRPKIWIVPDQDPNAFATGLDERHAHVAVTEGLLGALDRDELQAVVAHEMAHIRNHDVRLMTLLAALVGVIAILSDGTGRMIGRGAGRAAGRSRSARDSKGRLAILVLVLWLITLLLAPIISRVLALGVSRKREFLADASAAQFTRNPGALAAALRKIEDVGAPTSSIRHGSAHLCIADPLGRRLTSRQGLLADLLGTHPPMAIRIARLKQMAYQYQKTGVLEG